MTHELLNHLWQSTVFAAAVGLLSLAFLRNGAHTRYWLWFVASCKFLIPFSLLSDLGTGLSWRSAPATMPAALGDFARPFSVGTVANALSAEPGAASAVHGTGINWLLVCAAFWSLGTIAVAAYWMVRWLRLRAAVRSATPLDLASPIPALSSRMPNEPGVAGLFRPVLLLPEGICDRLLPAQMRAIVAHEMCHVRRRDNLTASIHMLVEAIFWFHPLVWWIGRRMIVEREAACDETVIEAGGDREAYAEALLTVCKFYVESPLASAAGVAGADLKKRIERIMTPCVTYKLGAAKKVLLAVAAAATIVVPIAIATLFAIPTGTLAQGQGGDSATFQNVTIHAGEPGAMDMLFSVGSSRFEFTGSLRQLIASGYDVESALVSGPEMLDARYTVEATVPGGMSWPGYSSVDTGRGMVRNMLADQFQLQIHHSAQSMPVFVLSSGGANVLMKVASPAEPGPGVSVGLTTISGTSLRMDDFIDLLSQRLGRPVLDQTGLKQTYDFHLDWKVNVTPGTAETLPRPTPEVLADALQTQLGLALQPATAPAEVLVVDHVSQPKALVPMRTAVQIDPTTFDAYAGHYVFGSGVVNIYRDGGRYFSQPPGQQAIEIFADAQGEYFTKMVDAQITFEKDASGEVTGLVLHQGGRDISMPRVDEATAKQMTDALSAKLRQKTATPGSDEALRRDLAELTAGKPHYDQMSSALAEVTKEQLPSLHTEFQALGALNSLKFTGVDPQGWDIYVAEYERGSVECHISLAADGKIAGVFLRPLP